MLRVAQCRQEVVYYFQEWGEANLRAVVLFTCLFSGLPKEHGFFSFSLSKEMGNLHFTGERKPPHKIGSLSYMSSSECLHECGWCWEKSCSEETDLSCPDVRLLPFAPPLSRCTLVRFKWLDTSTELHPAVAAPEKRAMRCGCQRGTLCNAETAVTDFPLSAWASEKRSYAAVVIKGLICLRVINVTPSPWCLLAVILWEFPCWRTHVSVACWPAQRRVLLSWGTAPPPWRQPCPAPVLSSPFC